jgi:DNA-binding MarR family transcriptional regulator
MLKLHLGHASTVAELARACNLDAGAMTRMLDRLEAKGLCKRIRSETDRRVVNIVLTDTGRTVAQGIQGVLYTVLNQHLTGLSVEEFSVFKSLLQRILANTA